MVGAFTCHYSVRLRRRLVGPASTESFTIHPRHHRGHSCPTGDSARPDRCGWRLSCRHRCHPGDQRSGGSQDQVAVVTADDVEPAARSFGCRACEQAFGGPGADDDHGPFDGQEVAAIGNPRTPAVGVAGMSVGAGRCRVDIRSFPSTVEQPRRRMGSEITTAGCETDAPRCRNVVRIQPNKAQRGLGT